MAKSRALTRFAPRPIIVNVPRRSGRLRRAGARVVRVARSAGRHGRKALPSIGVAIGGLVVGYADGKGFLAQLPPIAGSRMITIGLAGFALTRFSRNQSLRAAGLAALGAAAYAVGKAQAGGTTGDGGAGEGGGY